MDLEYKRFPKEEYEARWERAKKKMAVSDLDALIVTESNNFTYLSGAHGDFSYSRPTVFILPKNGNPVSIIHDFFDPSHQRESWLEDIRPYTSIFGIPVKMIKQVFSDLGIATGRIGAELGREQRLGLPFNDFVKITKELPHAEFVDGSDELWSLRMVKSPAEIAKMRKACQIGSDAYNKAFSAIQVGMTEKEAAKTLYDATVEGGGSSVWVLTNSGPYNYESGFLPNPSNHTLQKGNLLWFDLGCHYKGYASDFSRIAAIGEPSDDQKHLYDIVNSITIKCVEMIRPGILVSDISRFCNTEFEKAGLTDLWGKGDCSSKNSNRAQRLGHGIGMVTTEPPHVAIYDDTELKAGMVINIEPTIANQMGHFNIESDVLVTGDGFEVLSVATRDLLQI